MQFNTENFMKIQTVVLKILGGYLHLLRCLVHNEMITEDVWLCKKPPDYSYCTQVGHLHQPLGSTCTAEGGSNCISSLSYINHSLSNLCYSTSLSNRDHY